VALLTGDLVTEPLIAADGVISLRDPVVEESAISNHQPNHHVQQFWQARLVQTRKLTGG
jgi:hypothetical protein